jgi:hypothetical protein
MLLNGSLANEWPSDGMEVIVVIAIPAGAAISLHVPTYKCPVLLMTVAMLTM